MRTSTSGILVRVRLVWVMAVMPLAVSGQAARSRVIEAASLYTAEYKITHTQKLADGNVINGESKELAATDSQRRRMTATTETPLSGDQTPTTRVYVFDPVARTTTNWTSPGQRATVTATPEPGAARACPSNSAQNDGVKVDQAPPSRPKPVTEDLGTDIFQGVEAHGRRTTMTIPVGEIGNEAPLVHTTEIWMAVAPALRGLVVREISDDPQAGKRTRELVSLKQREPDESVFQPPSGYEIVNKAAPQTACLTEAVSTPEK